MQKVHFQARRAVTLMLGGVIIFTAIDQGNAHADETDAAPPAAEADRAEVTLDALVSQVDAPDASVADGEASQRADKTLDEATALYKQRRYTEAIQKLESALRRHRKDPRIHRMLGRVCYEQGSHGRARSHFSRALELSPDDRLVHCLLGRIAEDADDNETALLEYRRALACSDDDQALGTLLTLAWIAPVLESESYSTAAIDAWTQLDNRIADVSETDREDFDRLVGPDWSTNSAALHICEAYEQLGRDEMALQWLKKAIDRADDSADRAALQARYAAVAAKLGRPEESLEVSRELLATLADRPHDAADEIRAAFEPIRESYATLEKSDALLTDLANISEGHPVLLDLLADQYIATEQYDKAADALQEAAALAGDDASPKLQFKLARVSVSAGRPVEALRSVGAMLQANRNNEKAAVAFAQSLAEDNAALKDLRADVDAYLSNAPKDAVTRFLMGRLCDKLGMDKAADTYDRAAIEADPDFLPAYLAIGERQLAHYEWEKALATGRTARKTDLESGAAQRLIARAHDGMDHIDKAEAAYKKAIELDRQDAASMVDLAELMTRTGGRGLSVQRQLKSAITVDPANPQAYFLLIKSYLLEADPKITSEQRLQSATDTLDQMRRFAADSPEYKRMKAWFDLVFGKRTSQEEVNEAIDKYINALRDIQKEFPNDPGCVGDEADIYFQKNEYAKAAEAAAEAVRRDPTHIPSQEILFQSQQRLLEFDDAIATIGKVIEIYPNRALFRRRQALLHIIQQDWDRGIELLRAMADEPTLKDEQPRIRAELVNALDLSGNADEAVVAAKTFYEADPKALGARNLYLSALKAAGRNGQVVRLAESFYKDDPEDDNIRRMLLSAYWAAEEYDLAIAQLTAWAAEDPGSPDWIELLYRTFRVSGAADSAIEMARNIEYEDAVRGGLLLVNALLDADRTQEAITTARNLAQTQGTFRATWYPMILFQAKRYQEAADILSGLAQRRNLPAEEKRQVMLQLSFCYQQLEQNEAAQNALFEIFNENPHDIELSNDLGYTLADTGTNLDKAEEMIRLAIGERPRNPAYLDSIGWVRYKKGDFKTARKWLKKATKARPIVPYGGGGDFVLDVDGMSSNDDPVIYDHLGDAEFQLGDEDAARAAWEHAIQLYERGLELKRGRDDSAVIEGVRQKLDALKKGNQPPVAAVGEVTDKDVTEK